MKNEKCELETEEKKTLNKKHSHTVENHDGAAETHGLGYLTGKNPHRQDRKQRAGQRIQF